MPTGIDCTVYIDGQRAADGHRGEPATTPVVLSGLAVTWGRATTIDQPDASTCAFTMMDERGGLAFRDLLRTGAKIDVYATATVYPDPTVSTVVDPGFDQTPVGKRPGNVSSRSGAHPTVQLDGTNPMLQVAPGDAARGQSVTIAPDDFSSTDPGAWDQIPQLIAGQTWQVAVDVRAYAGSVITVQTVAFPDPTGKTSAHAGDLVTATGTGGWETIALDVTSAAQSEVWLGVQVSVTPVGPRWVDEPPTQSWADTPGTWVELAAFDVDNVQILAPTAGTVRDVLVYSGRVTDVQAAYDGAADAAMVEVTCIDFLGDLANVRVGDEPWAVETMGARFARILELTGLGVQALIDGTVSSIPVSYQDVDSQEATGLLQDLAQSVDAVMWSATHATLGPYIDVEDPANRPAQYVLTVNPDTGLVVITAATGLPDVLQVSACDVLRDPVTWIQSVSDVGTRTSITWLEQGTDPDSGQPSTTDRTYTVVDTALENQYGQRGVSVSTMLTTEDDAAAVAAKILARVSAMTGWRAEGLTIDDLALDSPDDVAVGMMLQLLDGTSRNGLALALTDLPDWSPITGQVPCYLEGGTYSYVDGAWVLELTVSNALNQGTTLPWMDVNPAWAWVDFDPTVSWAELHGVGPEPEQVTA